MSGTILARLAAAAFLLIAVLVAVIELGHQGEEVPAARPAASAVEEPVRGELQRCQSLGEAALEDRSWLDLWTEKRRRFLSTGESE